MQRISMAILLAAIYLMADSWQSAAHHVLGRPSYALNEDSNTPSAMQVETQIGDFFINYMVYPAFPRPNEAGRINLYVSKLDGGDAFNGKVEFKVRNDNWASWFGFDNKEEKLGAQVLDDHVYRQSFKFRERGSYFITANFTHNGSPHTIDFPLQVGAPSPFGPIGIAAAIITIVLLAIGLIQRRQALSGQTKIANSGGKKSRQ